MEILNEREKAVLDLIVESYIASAEPVGSRTISGAIKNRWSSATIRNIMADLEELGYLYKPHAVAGRIPTSKAFRYYVDGLDVPGLPGKKTLQALDTLLRPRYYYMGEIMADASRILAAISRYTSIVVEPRINAMFFKEVEFVKLSIHTILIVFITSSGMVHTRLVETEDNLDGDTLKNMKRYMNEKFEGTPFYVLKESIMEDMERDKTAFHQLLTKISETLETIIEGEDKRDVYIDGTSKMIRFPEFSDVERLRDLFHALERKEKLLRLLDKCLKEEGIHVILGTESDIKEMRDMSIITSTYRISDKSFGVLGVMGPIRMNYSRIIPIVDYTAKTVTDILRIM